ncbi:MAG: acetylglutamate kinase [Planctomycetota bacterium]
MSAAQRILVKVGGAILDDPETRASFAASVADTRARGSSVVVVHGGGAQVTRLTDALGLEPVRIRGLRVTDDATARAVLQVLAGEVNAILVAALQRAGASAVGLSGADGGLFDADVADAALGHVGVVSRVDASILDALGGAGYVPVVSTVTPAGDGSDVFLNVNADAAVAPLAAAWRADAVLFLSDVPHVRDGDARVPAIDRSAFTALEASEAIVGGMIPKVGAALAAAESLPEATVRIASGSERDAISAALDPSRGTRVFAAIEEVEA